MSTIEFKCGDRQEIDDVPDFIVEDFQVALNGHLQKQVDFDIRYWRLKSLIKSAVI